MNKVTWLKAVMILAAVPFLACAPSKERRKEGISVGNGVQPLLEYVSPHQFRLQYPDQMELTKNSAQTSVDIASQKGPVSRIHIQVVRRNTEYPGFAALNATRDRHVDNLRKALERKHKGAELKFVEFRGVHGYRIKEKNVIASLYYLLNGNLDLIVVTTEATAEGKSQSVVDAIMKSFTGDNERPFVTKVFMEPGLIKINKESFEGKIRFRALDPSGVALKVISGGTIIAPADGEDRASLKVDERFVDLGNGEFSLSFYLGKFAAKGNYLLKQLTVADNAGNIEVLKSEKNAVPLASFHVENADEDITGPAFGHVNVVNSEEVKAGGLLVLKIELTDATSGVAVGENGCVSLTRNGNEISQRLCGTLSLPNEKNSKEYLLTVKLEKNSGPGDYRLTEIVVHDKAGNPGVLRFPELTRLNGAPQIASVQGERPAPQSRAPGAMVAQAVPHVVSPPVDFTLGEARGGDDVPPLIEGAHFESADVRAGKAANLVIDATDVGTGIPLDKITVHLEPKDRGAGLPDVTTLTGTLTGGADNRFQAFLATTEWQAIGLYVVKEVVLLDRAGNVATWLNPERPALEIR